MTLKVYDKPRGQCLFSKDRIVSAERARDVLKECQQQDTHFICHKASIKGEEVVCRTFFDTRTSQMIRIAGRLDMIQFVPQGEE